MSTRESSRPTAPLTVAEARARVRRVVTAHQRAWAVGLEFSPITVGLRPPTEAAALADLPGVSAWIADWNHIAGGGRRSAPSPPDVPEVEFAVRRWAGLGTQRLPTRLRLGSTGAAVEFVGGRAQFRRLQSRAASVLDWLSTVRATADPSTEDRRLVRAHLGDLVALEESDFSRLLGVLDWLVAHPESGMYIRQLPIAGVDTKWLGRHRRVVTGLVTAVTGADDLGLAAMEPRVRLRLLHPELRMAGLDDLEVPWSQAAALSVPGLVAEDLRVLVVENLESFVALPTDGSWGSVVAINGGGYAASLVADLPWLSSCRVYYWGDIDSHGFGILNRFRAHVGHAESVLMDRGTLEAFRHLAVHEPRPLDVEPEHLQTLTEDEREVYRSLRACSGGSDDAEGVDSSRPGGADRPGGLRLEQERIAWPFVLERLTWALK